MSDPIEEARKRGEQWRQKHATLISIFEALHGFDPAMQTVFWFSRNVNIADNYPITLVQSDPEAVLRAAQMFGEQGCS